MYFLGKNKGITVLLFIQWNYWVLTTMDNHKLLVTKIFSTIHFVINIENP